MEFWRIAGEVESSLPRGKALVKALDFKRLPKVLLHEHLDGGVRPQTVIDLAKEQGYEDLPTTDAGELADWFHRGAQRGNLPEYLEGFAHTIAVMQSRDGLARVAKEFLEDMKNDGVVYAEIRFAPVFHTGGGLTLDEVMAAVLEGLREGEKEFGVSWGLIVCAMRNFKDSEEMAELAIKWRDEGVVGFDLAGEEAGYPPKDHIPAFQAVQRANFAITIHAGEAFGPESIWQALQFCGAHRLGHGTRLMEDIEVKEDGSLEMGRLARFVLDQRVPLEMCLSSNVDTGACPSIAEHPFPVLFRSGFRVFLNTDDRLMSRTEMSREFEIATEAYDMTIAELEKMTMSAAKSAFASHEERVRLMQRVLIPGYAALTAELVADVLKKRTSD
ncbi:MAG: adenosine deaminase [Roseibacillus sp.]